MCYYLGEDYSVRIYEYDDNGNCIKLKESGYGVDYDAEVTFEYTSVEVPAEDAWRIRNYQKNRLNLYS